MNMAVASVVLTDGGRLVAEPAALEAEPIPWRSPDLTPTNLATLLAARLGEPATADHAERLLRDLGAVVNRGSDSLYAMAPAGARWSLGARARWSILGVIDPTTGHVVRLEVRYLSGK
jgi:hypothetical protein